MAASPLIQSRSNRIEVSPLSIRRIREAIEREMAAARFERLQHAMLQILRFHSPSVRAT
jgi:hypothetical protein